MKQMVLKMMHASKGGSVEFHRSSGYVAISLQVLCKACCGVHNVLKLGQYSMLEAIKERIATIQKCMYQGLSGCHEDTLNGMVSFSFYRELVLGNFEFLGGVPQG